MNTSLEILHRADYWVLARYGSLMVNAWASSGTVEDMHRLERMQRVMTTDYPDGYSSLTVLLDLTPPSEEVRAAATRLAKSATTIIGSAYLLRGSGLRLSTMRMVLLGVSALQSRAPVQVHKELDDALEWLAGLPKQYQEFPAALPDMKRTIRDIIDAAPFVTPKGG